MAVGQFDREGDKNKLHPLFPTQPEMFPKEWGKGTYLQGEKVLTRSRPHCLFSIKGCHDWLHSERTWLQNGSLEHPTSGTSCFHECFTGRQILVQNEGNALFCLKEHTWSWEEQIRETEAKKFEIPSVLGGLCCLILLVSSVENVSLQNLTNIWTRQIFPMTDSQLSRIHARQQCGFGLLFQIRSCAPNRV